MKKGDIFNDAVLGDGIITEINKQGFEVKFYSCTEFYEWEKDYSHVWMWVVSLLGLALWVWLISFAL